MSQGRDDRFEPKRERAIELLLEGMSTPAVARELSVSRTTVWQWMQDPVFQSALLVAREGALNEAIHLVSNEAVKSVQAIVALRDDIETPPAVRLAAAKDLLDRFGLKAVEHVVLHRPDEEDDEESNDTGEQAAMKLRAVG